MVDASGNTENTHILIHLQLNKKINKIGKCFQIIFDNRTSDFFPPQVEFPGVQSAIYFEVSPGDGTSKSGVFLSLGKGANLGYH